MKPALSSAKSTSSIITTKRKSTDDRADVDDDEQHREEFGAEKNEKSGGVEERQDQEQHGVHGVLREDDHRARSDRKHRKEIKETRRSHVRRSSYCSLSPSLAGTGSYRYFASSAMFFAISRSQRSPLASSRSLS